MGKKKRKMYFSKKELNQTIAEQLLLWEEGSCDFFTIFDEIESERLGFKDLEYL